MLMQPESGLDVSAWRLMRDTAGQQSAEQELRPHMAQSFVQQPVLLIMLILQ